MLMKPEVSRGQPLSALAFALLLFAAPASLAQDVVIDFETTPEHGCDHLDYPTPLQGFTFWSEEDLLFICDGDGSTMASSDSAALIEASDATTFTMHKADDGLFDLISFQASVRQPSSWHASIPTKGAPGNGTYSANGPGIEYDGFYYVGSRSFRFDEASYLTWDIPATEGPADRAWINLVTDIDPPLSTLEGPQRIEVRWPLSPLSILELGYGSHAALTTGTLLGSTVLNPETGQLRTIYLNEAGVEIVNKYRSDGGLLTLAFHLPDAYTGARYGPTPFLRITDATTLEIEEASGSIKRNSAYIIVNGQRPEGYWPRYIFPLSEVVADGPGGDPDFKTFTLPDDFTDLEWVRFWVGAIDGDQFSHIMVDDISVSYVPEPGLAALQASALALLALIAGLAGRSGLRPR